MLTEIIYFLLPAALANMMPVFVKNKMKYLKYPLDFGFSFNEKRILGENKTFRGLAGAIIGSILIVYLQFVLYDFRIFREISLVDYTQVNFLWFGFLIGFGVMFGDALASFIKRRLNYSPGKSLLIIDQINGVIGLGIFVVPFYLKSWKIFINLLFVWLVGHFILKFLGYLLKLGNKA